MRKLLFLLLGFNLAFAAVQDTKTSIKSSSKKSKPLSFFIGGGVQNYSYKEYAPSAEGGGKLMEIAGNLWGIDVGASLQKEFVEHIIKLAYFSSLDTNYDGRIQNGGAYKSPSSDYYFFAEYHLLPYILRSNSLTIKGDLGLGHRFLHNAVENSYRRDQHYLYINAGINSELALTQSVISFLKLNYLGLIGGWHTTFLSDIGYDRDLDFTQRFGKGVRAELGFQKLFKSISFELSAYYELWNVGESNTKFAINQQGQNAPFVEPHNYTKVYGLRGGIRF